MIPHSYDIRKPRFVVRRPDLSDSWRSFETLSPSEARFWNSLGYCVSEFRWNGQFFQQVEEE